jgi:hypothetical protein
MGVKLAAALRRPACPAGNRPGNKKMLPRRRIGATLATSCRCICMGNADITLRHLSRRHAEALARPYVAGGPFEVVRWADTQVTAVERRLDKTLLLRSAGDLQALEIEFEFAYANDLPDRIHEYQGLSRLAFRAEPPGLEPPLMETVVILLTGRTRPWPEEHTLRTGWRRRFSRTHFRIDAIYQRTVAELRARGSPFWLAFTPLCPDATLKDMRRVVAAIRAEVPIDDERCDLFAALLVLADVDPWGHTLRKEIEAMIYEDPVDLITVSKTLRDAYDKGAKEMAQRMLRGLLAKRLHRALTAHEDEALAARAAIAPEEAQDKVLALEGEALAAWLLGDTGGRAAPAKAARAMGRRAASSKRT